MTAVATVIWAFSGTDFDPRQAEHILKHCRHPSAVATAWLHFIETESMHDSLSLALSPINNENDWP